MKTIKTLTTWNPVTGCDKVSQSCENCWAMRDWARLAKTPGTVHFGREFTDVRCHSEKLNQPLHWIKPRLIIVSNTSDLFHESVPDGFIDRVFAAMALSEQHTFQVLTKRPERMQTYMNHPDRREMIGIANEGFATPDWLDEHWPLKNVWLGVSIEDQETANNRIPLLLATPAVVHWACAEPLLGAVDLVKADAFAGINAAVDWVVAGGETSPDARPMHIEWARSLRDQCEAACVPFLFRQWGEWAPECNLDQNGPDGISINNACYHIFDGGLRSYRIGKKRAGRLLDGKQFDGCPSLP